MPLLFISLFSSFVFQLTRCVETSPWRDEFRRRCHYGQHSVAPSTPFVPKLGCPLRESIQNLVPQRLRSGTRERADTWHENARCASHAMTSQAGHVTLRVPNSTVYTTKSSRRAEGPGEGGAEESGSAAVSRRPNGLANPMPSPPPDFDREPDARLVPRMACAQPREGRSAGSAHRTS
eukprot:SAG11_NODE_2015_length_3921_cov_2.436944_3_plen_178_part_00